MTTFIPTRFFTWRNVAVLALVGALLAGGARIALGDDGPSEDALRKDDYAVGELDTADDSDDDDLDLTASGSRRDGDDTRGNDGTNGGNNTGDGDDTRGNDGTNGGNNTGDGDQTARNDGTNGGDNTGDGDQTAGNDGTNGGDNTGDGTNTNSADSND